jgi:hypothetical protein
MHDPNSPESPLRDRWFYAEANRLFVRRPLESELGYAEVEVGPSSDAYDPRVDEDEERWVGLPHTD